MENIGQLLQKTRRTLPESWPADKNNIPGRVICNRCNLLQNWFWINSDCENLFPSRWMKHQCLCQIIENVSEALNQAIDQKDFITREVEINGQTKKYQSWKIGDMETCVKDWEEKIRFTKELLGKLLGLKKEKDPNVKYLEIRLELGKKYNAWQELFDCKNEQETCEVLSALYDDGSDKFLLDLEQIRQELFS